MTTRSNRKASITQISSCEELESGSSASIGYIDEQDKQALAMLSSESQTLYKLMIKSMTQLQEALISKLSEKVVILEQKLIVLETTVQNQAEKIDKVSILERQFETLKSVMQDQATIIEELQQEKHRNLFILTGRGVPHGNNNEDCKTTVLEVVRNKVKVILEPSSIIEAHRMGQHDPTKAMDTRPIKFRVSNQDVIRGLLPSIIKMKPDVFINESLTLSRKKILDKARLVRKHHPGLIKQVFSQNGTIFVKRIKEGPKFSIKSESDLDNYLIKVGTVNPVQLFENIIA